MIKTAQLKQSSKEQLKGNWAVAVIVFFIFSSIMTLTSYIGNRETIFYFIVSTALLIFSGPLIVSLNRFLLNLIYKKSKPEIYDLLDFKDVFFKSILIRLVISMIVSAGTVMFIIPGVVGYILTSQSLYILAENPDMTPIECITESSKMMKGNMLKYLYTGLSFIGWAIVGAFTFGIAYLWLVPYFQLTFANFYVELKNK
ncbi:MAG: DUF975 family protein [Peptostreptococcaceae bacterium]